MSKVTLPAYVVIGALVGGLLRDANAQEAAIPGESPLDRALRQLTEQGKKEEHAAEAPEKTPEKAAEKAPEKAVEKAPEKKVEAPAEAPTGHLDSERNLHIQDSTGRHTVVPPEDYVSYKIEADFGYFAHVMHLNHATNTVYEAPAAVNADLHLMLQAGNVAMAEARYVPGDKFLNYFEGGLHTKQPITPDLDIILDLPVRFNADGRHDGNSAIMLNVAPAVGAEYHIPSEILPHLFAGIEAGLTVPMVFLADGHGAQVNQLFIKPYVSLHMWEAAKDITIEPTVSLEHVGFLRGHGGLSEEMGSSTFIGIGVRGDYGRTAEEKIQKAAVEPSTTKVAGRGKGEHEQGL